MKFKIAEIESLVKHYQSETINITCWLAQDWLEHWRNWHRLRSITTTLLNSLADIWVRQDNGKGHCPVCDEHTTHSYDCPIYWLEDHVRQAHKLAGETIISASQTEIDFGEIKPGDSLTIRFTVIKELDGWPGLWQIESPELGKVRISKEDIERNRTNYVNPAD